MTARAHAAAVFALLDVEAPGSKFFYDGFVPDDVEFPYGVMYVSTPLDRGRRLSAHMSQRLFTVAILCVGGDPDEARWVSEKASARLRRVRPTVAGRTCTPLMLASSTQVNPDQSVTPPRWTCTDVWQFSSAGSLTA